MFYFYSGASHSFISERFALMHDIIDGEMHSPLAVSTPGSHCHATNMSPNVPIEIEGLDFFASLIVLQPSNIDVILGMDWLKAHCALIDYAAKTVQLLHPSDQIVSYSAKFIET
jgi:hypothetical protein